MRTIDYPSTPTWMLRKIAWDLSAALEPDAGLLNYYAMTDARKELRAVQAVLRQRQWTKTQWKKSEKTAKT